MVNPLGEDIETLGAWFGRDEITEATMPVPDDERHMVTLVSWHAPSAGFSSVHFIVALLPALTDDEEGAHTTLSTGLFFIVSGVSAVFVAVVPPSDGDAVTVNGDVYVPATVGVADHWTVWVVV